MVAFISALGYGFGETIARISGWSVFMCIAASFAVGIVLEEIQNAMEDKMRRITIADVMADANKVIEN